LHPQGVLKSHPHAKEFFKRDIHNIIDFFNREYDLNYNEEEIAQKISEGVFDE